MKKLVLPILLFILGIGISTYVIYFLSPQGVGGEFVYQNLGLLGVSLFISVAMGGGLLLYLASKILSKLGLGKANFRVSLRRGVMIGVFTLMLGLLQVSRINNLLNLVLLVLIFILIETYFWEK